jgi:hypothetical protein
MKIFFIAFIILGGSLLFLSCEENVNCYGDLQEGYVLNCIIRSDTTFQTATLSKTYIVDNFDPYSYPESNAIEGATIRIWKSDDSVAVMRDTTITEPESSVYNGDYILYYTKSFQPKNNSTISIEALLPDGTRLQSSIKVPAKVSIENTSEKIPLENKGPINITWNTNQTDPVFITRIYIIYKKEENGITTRYKKVVPLSYVNYNNADIPIYSTPTSNNYVSIGMETIDKAMESISTGDLDKSKYTILSFMTEIISLNDELSKYYNSTNRSLDSYSVKLNETDYSNIINGYGIFGVYVRKYTVIRFTHAYIESFGYTPGLSDVE